MNKNIALFKKFYFLLIIFCSFIQIIISETIDDYIILGMVISLNLLILFYCIDENKFYKFPISLLINNFNNDLTTIYNSGVSVVDQGLSLAIYSGCKKIYILGVELNGIAYLMAGQDSHFSGKDPDYKNHNGWKYSRSMDSNSRGIRQLHRFNDLCKKRNIELINLSKRGLLDFTLQDNFDNLFTS